MLAVRTANENVRSRKFGDSPGTVSAGGSLLKKMGATIIFSRRGSALWKKKVPADCSYVRRGSCRISPNLGSGQAVLNLRDPHAESCGYFALGETVDGSILSPETLDSPGTVSTGGRFS
jgi:hypothetical protein